MGYLHSVSIFGVLANWWPLILIHLQAGLFYQSDGDRKQYLSAQGPFVSLHKQGSVKAVFFVLEDTPILSFWNLISSFSCGWTRHLEIGRHPSGNLSSCLLLCPLPNARSNIVWSPSVLKHLRQSTKLCARSHLLDSYGTRITTNLQDILQGAEDIWHYLPCKWIEMSAGLCCPDRVNGPKCATNHPYCDQQKVSTPLQATKLQCGRKCHLECFENSLSCAISTMREIRSWIWKR